MLFDIASRPLLADGVGWNHMDGWGWGGMAFGWLMMAGLVLLVVWAVSGGATRPSTDTALDVLAERFARGEITSEEYRERHEVLAQGRKKKTR